METRANFVLIGAFALAGFFGILAFFLWFARIELDRQFAYYDVDFPTVSGLSDASDVRFAGLPVGRVVDVRLSPTEDGTVRVRLEVGSETPVRTDSIATIESQGVTGVSFVGITAGTPDAPLLQEATERGIPMIEPGRSVLQSLSQEAPQILSETLQVVRDIRTLIGGENQQRVQNILENVERSSVAFADALDDFSNVSQTVSDFADEIGRFNTTLDSLTTDVSGVLSAAETTLASVDDLAKDAQGLVARGSDTLTRAQGPIAAAERYINEDLGPATDQLRSSISEIEARISALGDTADALMATYDQTGQIASARLNEARETITATNELIARLDQTLGSVDTAAQRLDGLIVDGANPLIAELRVATQEATSVIRKVGETADIDLPAIVSDVRAAADSASRMFEEVGNDLSSASARIDGLVATAGDTLETARTTFANANETLTAINGALETGDRALQAAEGAFTGAQRVIDEDVADITGRLSSTLDELEAAIGAVAADIPGVTEELRAASRSAESAFAQIESAVDGSAPAFRDFAATALPQYGRLAVETRALIENLDALTEQIRRDPSRFFLDPRAPEYRR
ncbi:MlaD family protein [Oceanibium sediminis]|uniref:MlaD family protein n=1 Tax=Oceanibium sediminis TaxID=2026339 RepID=UPI000DD4C1D4|nr:MlaD family protein [Oceanibium sediminis]